MSSTGFVSVRESHSSATNSLLSSVQQSPSVTPVSRIQKTCTNIPLKSERVTAATSSSLSKELEEDVQRQYEFIKSIRIVYYKNIYSLFFKLKGEYYRM